MAARKRNGGVERNAYIAMDNEVEPRLALRKPLFEAPGTTEHRPVNGRARASENRLDKAPKNSSIEHVVGRSTSARAERRAEEKAAEQRLQTPEELFAMLDREAKAKGRAKKNHLTDERPKVWQLGSWMEGEKPCPDELLSWQDGE